MRIFVDGRGVCGCRTLRISLLNHAVLLCRSQTACRIVGSSGSESSLERLHCSIGIVLNHIGSSWGEPLWKEMPHSHYPSLPFTTHPKTAHHQLIENSPLQGVSRVWPFAAEVSAQFIKILFHKYGPKMPKNWADRHFWLACVGFGHSGTSFAIYCKFILILHFCGAPYPHHPTSNFKSAQSSVRSLVSQICAPWCCGKVPCESVQYCQPGAHCALALCA